MAEITKSFIIFVAEVIALILVFSVIFTPEGIAVNTFNYFIFAEPIMLQNYLASAITAGSLTDGEFFSNIKTSGLPHTIEISIKDEIPYVNVIPAQGVLIKTKFASLEPIPIITDCTILNRTIILPKRLSQTIIVEKTFENDKCNFVIRI